MYLKELGESGHGWHKVWDFKISQKLGNKLRNNYCQMLLSRIINGTMEHVSKY